MGNGCNIDLPTVIAIIGILALYHIYYRSRKDDIKGKVQKLEGQLELLVKLFPELKNLEKLGDYKKLSEEEIRKTISDIWKTTNITPEAISATIDEKVEKKLSDQDKRIAEIVGRKLTEINQQRKQQRKKPIGDAEDYLMLGNAEFYSGNYQKSLEYYEKAIELKPDLAEAWYNKGAALGNLGRHGEALKAFDKAIELKPDYAEAWDNKGVALSKLGRQEEGALAAHEKAIALKPDDAEAWTNKGAALANLGRYDEALKACDKAIELKPDYANAWYNKACAYSLMKDKSKALENLAKAISLDSKYKEKSKKDEDFKDLWGDPDFLKLVE